MRRAKIVATFGPESASPERVRALVEAGLDVARLNLSHGTHSDHEEIYRLIRAESDRTGRGVGILVDLQGPKIRLGTFEAGPVTLQPGARFVITTEDVAGTVERCSTTYEGLARDVGAGDDLLLDDGRVRVVVEEVIDNDVVTRVVVGGQVSNHKGINLPGVEVSVPALSDKDVADLRWALHLRADVIALSFVRSAHDAEAVRRVMDEENVRLPVIAKIEKPQAVERLAEIVEAFDGFMVARGDLGVEMPLAQVPIVQKRIIDLARRAHKPVIVATQMLDSMTLAPHPTRAEASDVANAVLDGADALMLSGETSVGRHPIETVRTMSRIIEATEESGGDLMADIDGHETQGKNGAIAKAAVQIAERLNVRYLVAFSQSGDSARRLAMWRSRVPVLAFTPEPAVRSQLALSWGMETFLVPSVQHTDEMVLQVDRSLLEIGRCSEGDHVVIVAGSPPGIPGSTNALRVHRMGDAIMGVAPAYRSGM